MTIYFSNKTPIDIAAIEIMGVSVKENGSPIGYFGTGLKFAIATILRFGGQVTLWRNGQPWVFTEQTQEIRGQQFARVTMVTPTGEVRPLGFTTALGRDWVLWKAFRELESNCRDENGQSGPKRPDFADFGTIFEIEGLDQVYMEREDIFLATKPLVASGQVEIHPLSKDTRAIYYRGVKAGQLATSAAYTYNVLENSTLTEDRTIESLWRPSVLIARLLASDASEIMLEKTLLAGTHSWETQNLHSWPETFSETFDEFIKDNLRDKNLLPAAKETWLSVGDNRESNFKKAQWTAARIHQTVAALEIVQRMSEGAARLAFEDVHVVESLGASVFGLAKKGKIYLALQTFDLGTRFVASTIYEEWLHINESLYDESRAMQNRLFERLATMTERVMELEEAVGRDEGTIFLTKSKLLANPELDDEIPF